MVGICQGETEIPLPPRGKRAKEPGRSGRTGIFIEAIRQVGDQTSICWIASNHGASQKIEL